MKTRQSIMETDKLIFYTVLIFTSKAGNLLKSPRFYSTCRQVYWMFGRALLFFIMSVVEKRKAILVACCLNNLYGCYISLQTFFNFLIMKKQQKWNKIIHMIISSTISKSSTKWVKEIPKDFEFDPDRLAHGGIIFVPVRKSMRNGKKTSACLKKVLRNYALSWDLTLFRKIKPEWPQHYITLQMKVGCEKSHILLVSGNRQFPKLSDVSLKLSQNTWR